MQAKDEDMAMFPDIKNKDRKTYAGMVYAVDRGVGKLVETLKKIISMIIRLSYL
ncbi:hypothetical protein P4S63_25975 [Pseudoalteromonas sp. B193]